MNKFLEIESFFSPTISKLYEQPVEEVNNVSDSNFTDVICLWNKQIIPKLSPFQNVAEPYGSVQWYEKCIQIIQSYRADFRNYILNMGPIAIKWPFIKSVGYESQIQKIIDYSSTQRDAGDHYLSILIACSLAERILGNIYLMEGKFVPFLLRDLLDSLEVKHQLGNSLVEFFKILIGSVNGLNLRNIAWHGFLSPKDVHPEFASLLVYALHLCGKKISLSNCKIVTRPYLNLLEVCMPLQNIWKSIEIKYDDTLVIIESSSLVPSIMKPFWIKSLHMILDRNADVLFVLLPLLENSLRILYAYIYNCPSRILTATNSEFYITLDEILSPWYVVSYSESPSSGDESESKLFQLDESMLELSLANAPQTMASNCNLTNVQKSHGGPKKENNIESKNLVKCNILPQVLGKQLTEALYDLFILPSGPRIRDRVSHGEVLPESVPFNLIVYLFKLCLLVLFVNKWRFIDKFEKMALYTIKCQCESVQNDKLCSNHYFVEIDNFAFENFKEKSIKIENDLISKLVSNLCSYRSVFHPVSLLRNNFISILECLSTWKDWDHPINLINLNWNEYTTKFSSSVINFGKYLNIPESLSTFCFKSSHDLIDVIKPYIQTVLFSSNTELEILKLLQRITNSIHISINNIQSSLKLKLQSFLVKSLRSRQRENYRKQLEIIPYIVDNITFILNILVMIYMNKNHIALISVSQFNALIKILKKILKLFENLATYTESTVNKYQESLSILETNTTFLLRCCAV